MAQGAAFVPVSPVSPAKPLATKAILSAQAPSAANTNAARVQSTPGTGAKPPAAPAAPKAQPRPVAAPAAKPLAIAPAPPMRKAIPTPVEEMPTRVGPMPVAAAKVAQPPLEQDLRPIVRALVESAFAPLERKLRDLQTRVDELERRPPPAPVITAAPTPVAPVVRAYAPSQADLVPGRLLDVAAIERTIKLDPGMDAFDGRRRRLRLVLAVAFGLVVLFGGLFAALAESYTHAHP